MEYDSLDFSALPSVVGASIAGGDDSEVVLPVLDVNTLAGHEVLDASSGSGEAASKTNNTNDGASVHPSRD